MTNEDFLKELVDNTKKEYQCFTDFQNIVLALFDATHKILCDNNIVYYAFFGTLLGAYRDNGFIPWDFDFDLIIDYRDAIKALQALEKNLPEDMYVISNFNDKKFPYHMIRVCKKGLFHTIHVDIFYYFGYNESDIQKLESRIPYLYRLRTNKLKQFDTEQYIGKTGTILKILFYLSKAKMLGKSLRKIDKTYDAMLTKTPLQDAEYVSTACAKLHRIKKEFLGTPQLLTINGHPICVPENIEAILNMLYDGDLGYLPFEARYNEYTSGLQIIKKAKVKESTL